MSAVPVLLKTRPNADCAALRLTVCAVFTVEMLNSAMSALPGGVAGSGVVAFPAVDQKLAVFHPVPVPSQNLLAPNVRSDAASPSITVHTTTGARHIRLARMATSP